MKKEKILEDIQSLIQDIDKCENELLRSKSEGDTKMFLKTLYEIERLLVAAHQELSFLRDYIKEGVNNDVEYTSSTACGEVKAVEYFLNEPKEGGKDEQD